MHSHSSEVLGGVISYYLDRYIAMVIIECIRVFEGRYTNIAGTAINNLLKNSTPITLAGATDSIA